MGVKDFRKVFSSAAELHVSDSSLVKQKVIAIDVNLSICAAVKAMHNKTHLTDLRGIPTAGTQVLCNTILRLKKSGAKDIIGIIDNKEANPMKQEEYNKRKLLRDKAKQMSMEASSIEEKNKFDTQSWHLDDNVINDAKTLMTLMGVKYIIAPVGREAEQVAADMAKIGLVDIVISRDTDTLMFGSPNLLIPEKITINGKRYNYMFYKLDTILDKFNINIDQFRKMCISLGTDFAEKTAGVGKVTVFTKGLNKPLSDKQQLAFDYISSPLTTKLEINKSSYNKDELINWLVVEKSFNRERIEKWLTDASL